MKLPIALGLTLLFAACGPSSAPEKTDTPAVSGDESSTEPNAKLVSIESAVREVRCGCKIDGVGKCGNYVDVDGEWLEIGNPKAHGLGVMEWCAAKGEVRAKTAGERASGGVMLTELEVE